MTAGSCENQLANAETHLDNANKEAPRAQSQRAAAQEEAAHTSRAAAGQIAHAFIIVTSLSSMTLAEHGNDFCRGLRSQLADTETHLDTAKKAAAHAQSQRAAAQEEAARASEEAARASPAADEAAAAAAGQAAQARAAHEAAQAAQPKTIVVQEMVEVEEEDLGLLNAPVQVCAACPHMFLIVASLA